MKRGEESITEKCKHKASMRQLRPGTGKAEGLKSNYPGQILKSTHMQNSFLRGKLKKSCPRILFKIINYCKYLNITNT